MNILFKNSSLNYLKFKKVILIEIFRKYPGKPGVIWE